MFLAEIPKSAGTIIMVVVLVALVAVVFIMPMINNKKQQKSYKDMLDNVKVGSTVKTIGGIVGKVLGVTTVGAQKEIVVETGEDGSKTTMIFDVNAIYQVIDEATHEPIPMAAPQKNVKKGGKGRQESAPETDAFAQESAPAESAEPAEQADAEAPQDEVSH